MANFKNTHEFFHGLTLKSLYIVLIRDTCEATLTNVHEDAIDVFFVVHGGALVTLLL